MAVALTGIFTKKYLHRVAELEKSEARLVLVNNVNASILFMPLILVCGEGATLASSVAILMPRFWLSLGVAGLFGVGLAYISVVCIEITSPLTHGVSGTAKSACQTLLGVIYYVEWSLKTGLWWVSNLLVIVGSLLYAYIRHREMLQAQVQALPQKEDVSAKLEVDKNSSSSGGGGSCGTPATNSTAIIQVERAS